MGFDTGNRGKKRLVSEINVTPLVDVMLVLLIIFMITAPMMTEGVDIDLPETTSKALRQNEQPIIIAIDNKKVISLDGNTVSEKLLLQQLKGLPEDRKEESIFLKADKNLPYGFVINIMAGIKSAGFNKLGMITTPEEE
ncbi:MAG: protein TolR [Desulfotalea sp.]